VAVAGSFSAAMDISVSSPCNLEYFLYLVFRYTREWMKKKTNMFAFGRGISHVKNEKGSFFPVK
jgi:hypothetical protein